jgi:hypothetical protein
VANHSANVSQSARALLQRALDVVWNADQTVETEDNFPGWLLFTGTVWVTI